MQVPRCGPAGGGGGGLGFAAGGGVRITARGGDDTRAGAAPRGGPQGTRAVRHRYYPI